MNFQHKQWAVILVGMLLAIVVVVLAWNLLGSRTVIAPSRDTTSSTPSAASSTPAGPAHITEHATYYDIDLTYPSATPLSADVNARAVASMKADMEAVAAQFKKDGNFANLTHDDIQMMGLDQRKEALSSEYTMYSGAHTVSYVFVIYEDTLGAHPNAFYKTATFNLQTGQELAIGDLFSDLNYLAVLSQRTRADLPGIILNMSGYEGDPDMISDGTTPTTDNFQNFAIDGKTLRIIFAPYQVGPWALGTVTDPIPLSALSGSLKVAYGS